MLLARGLAKGFPPEWWNLERPQVVSDIHRQYFQAGSQVVHSNTFGANRIRLAAFGLEDQLAAINIAGVQLARSVCPSHAFIAGDIGPSDEFPQTTRAAIMDRFIEIFAEQAAVLARAGADLLSIESMYDLQEARAALAGCRQACRLPVIVSLTIRSGPGGFMTWRGNRPLPSLSLLIEEGATATGINCTLDTESMLPLVEELCAAFNAPLLFQPNGGQPREIEGQLKYDETPEHFAARLVEFARRGATHLGGCCGIDPQHIFAAAQSLSGLKNWMNCN